MTRDDRLTTEQERDLVLAAEAGDALAARTLVEVFLPAILALARTFQRGDAVEQRELVQEGVAGLLFAVRRFDPALATPCWAYASFWVRKAMQELVADLARPVVLSDRAVRALSAVRAARSEFVHRYGGEPTSEYLSRITGLPSDQVASLLTAARPPRSLHEPLSVEGAGAETVGDRIVDQAAEQAYQLVLDQIEIQEVQDLATRLTERERAVILAHYGLGQPTQTFHEIGGWLGLSAERARQIEVGALDKLRELLSRPAVATAQPS